MAADIQIQIFSNEFEENATRLNTRHRYTNLAAVQMGFRAPFLHIIALTFTIFVWRLWSINFAIAILISYFLAVIVFLSITYVLLATNLTQYGHVGEVFRMDGGMMWVALDVSQRRPLVVGMVGLKPKSASLAEVVRYVVHYEYRGKGIGRRLLSTAIKFARDSDYIAIEAEVAWTAVIPIYERRGFRLHHSSYSPCAFLPMFRVLHFVKRLK